MADDAPVPGPLAVLPGVAAALACGAMASGGPLAKLTIAGLLTLPCAASSYLAASARADEQAARRRLITGSVAATLAVVVLSLFAGILKATTHHRALGGTTFAVVGALVGVGCLAVGWRMGGLLSRWPVASATTFGIALIAMGWALRRGGMMDPSHLDAAAILISLAGGWFFGITEAPTRAIARGVAGATAALVLTGLSLTRSGAAAEVSQRGNLASALARVANPSLPPPPRAVDPTHGEP